MSRTRRASDNIRHKYLVAFSTPDSDDSYAIDAWELLEGPLDLPELNAVAANFDTIIRAAAEFKQSLGVNPASISRPHQPGSLAIKVIGEPVVGEFRLTPIAIGQVTALDHDFTNFAGCDRFAIISDKSDLDIIRNVPDWKCPVRNALVQRPPGPGDDGSFRRRKRVNKCAC